jgi:short-subunit dehydrogenase
MAQTSKPLAVVTGASTGIGYELAKCCAQEGFDLVVVADEPEIKTAAKDLEALGAKVDALQADLADVDGVDKLYEAIGGRPVINTNITGTVYLIQKVGRDMRERGRGRVLITGSIAGFVPGTDQAIYNASKAFLDSFSFALRAELKETGITVTCLMPGATETEFFARADVLDTKVGQGKKDDAGDVAHMGFKAMMKGEGDVMTGWNNKLQSAIANVTPASVLAEQHRKKAEPGSAAKH